MHTTPGNMNNKLLFKTLLVLSLLVSLVVGQNPDPKWNIAEPETSYRGMQLDLDYRVGDHVREQYVSIDLFIDDDCTKPILPETNDFIIIDIVNDLSPFGTGIGTREMTVNMNIDPTTVARSPVITFNSITIDGEVQAAVSFCARFNLWDPDDPFSTTPARSRDHVVVVGVRLTDDIGITGIITDEEERFGAEAFECDEDNNPIETPMTKNQGDRIKVCVQPNSFAQDFGAVMKSVNSLTLTRGDVSQGVLVPQGVVKDLIRTVYRCIPGQVMCTIDAVVSNDFFYSPGTVFAVGEALIQYGFNIRGRQVEKVVSVPVQRRAREPGGFIGGRPFELQFDVEPSAAIYNAVAYECDARNRPLDQEKLERLRTPREQIRICVIPDAEAIARGVYIRAIASFFFEQGDLVQFAVEPTAKQAADGNSLLICYPGQPLCAFKTRISDKFFSSWDPVVGTGEIYLQFGNELKPLSGRRAQVTGQRNTQITDAGFAGAAAVSIEFNVDPTYVPPSEKTWQDKVNDWWLNTPLFVRILYIIVLIVVLGILFCILYGLFCGWDIIKKEKKEDPSNPRVIVQPIYVAPAAPEDVENGERDFCDCLSNPEEYYFDVDDEPREQARTRAMPTDDEVPESVYMDDDATLPSKFPDESYSPKSSRSPYQYTSEMLELENGSAHSGKRPSSRRSVGADSTRTPRGSKKSASKSPKQSRKNMDENGIRVSNHSSKSPRSTRSKATTVDDDGIRVSNHSSGSPRKRKKKNGASKNGDDGSMRSPRPGSKRSSSVPDMEQSPKSVRSTRSKGRTPKSERASKSSANSPRRKKGTIDAPPF